ncbi:MAG: 23S rRNA (adenine(2503)-C(2))-methyltransferase RlmN [Bacteroidia bacterium]
MQKNNNIRNFTQPELVTVLEEMGQKKFRSKQVFEWLWKQHTLDFEQMSNLAKDLRDLLKEKFVTEPVTIDQVRASSDGTRKYIFRLADGNEVEGVLIPTPTRVTACVSSQAGCSLSCKFCATGYLDLKKNLAHYEIYDQVQLLNKESELHFDRPITNIVYMGMGEPLLNYKNVLRSIEIITSPAGMNMSPRRITVSTAGIAKMIKKLGDDDARFEFALSLHAANDEKRNQIMPINEHNSLEALGEALRYFYEKTKTRVTLEYCIFKDLNDSKQDALELAEFARTVPSKINIIEYNPISEANFLNTTSQKMDEFVQVLYAKGHIVNLRRSRGKDIDGACGQLALKTRK